MPRYSDRSFTEKVGAAVLWPFKVLGLLVAAVLLVVAYPIVACINLATGEGTFANRAKVAATWPLGILAMNDFMSLGGMNSPTLSRISSALGRWYAKIKN